MSEKMTRAAVVFGSITAAGVVMILAGTQMVLPAAAAVVLPQVGGALVAGAIAFFLVETFRLTEAAG